MADVPHFDLPFRRGADGRAVTVEQDSIDEIANCVEAILRTRQGERDEHPAFGSDELVFGQLPLDMTTVAAQIRQWEQRVDLLIEQAPDRFDELLTRLRITVRTEG